MDSFLLDSNMEGFIGEKLNITNGVFVSMINCFVSDFGNRTVIISLSKDFQ